MRAILVQLAPLILKLIHLHLVTAAGLTADAPITGSVVGRDCAIAATQDAIALEAVRTTHACVV